MSHLRAKIRSQPVELAIFAIALLILVGLLTYADNHYAKDKRGAMTFIPQWLGTRFLLIDGQSPDEDETTLAIQRFIFGAPARPDQDQTLFPTPFFPF
jgi:hypothetical protein